MLQLQHFILKKSEVSGEIFRESCLIAREIFLIGVSDGVELMGEELLELVQIGSRLLLLLYPGLIAAGVI